MCGKSLNSIMSKEHLALASCTVRFLLKYYREYDVASLLNVSTSTVSRYSKGKILVQQDKLEKILTHVEELLRSTFNPNVLLSEKLDYDTLCTFAFVALRRLTKKDVVEADVILSFPDASLVLAYILSNLTGLPVNVMYVPPFIPDNVTKCTILKLGSSSRFILCSHKMSRGKLRRSSVIVIMPAAIPATPSFAKALASGLSHEYNIVKLIAITCNAGPNAAEGSIYKQMICLTRVGDDRGFKG